MNNLTYQNWYDIKKEKEANILYERVMKDVLKKDVLNEAEEYTEVSTKYMGKLVTKRIGVNPDSRAGKQLTSKFATVYDKVIDSGMKVTEALNPDLIDASVIYVKNLIGLNENKKSNKRLLKEGWGLDDLGKAVAYILESLGKVLSSLLGPKLVFTLFIGAIIYGCWTKVKEYLPDTGEKLGKGLSAAAGTAQNVTQTTEKVTGAASALAGTAQTGAMKVEEKATILAYCKSGKSWRPGAGIRVNKGEYVRVKYSGDPNIYVVEVADVDSEGDANNPPNTQWNPGKEYKCPRN
jgi:hypothetical protein